MCKIELVRACLASVFVDHSLSAYHFLFNLDLLSIFTHSAPCVRIAARTGETCVCEQKVGASSGVGGILLAATEVMISRGPF